MKKILCGISMLLCWLTVFGQQVVTPSQGVRIREIDLAPGGTARTIEFPNGTIQDLGGGIFRIATGGGTVGGAVLVNGTTVTDPNFTNTTTMYFVVTAGTNITAYATNIVDAVIASGAAINAAKIADGSVTSAEFQTIDFTSSGQTQMNTKAPLASPTFTGNPLGPTPAANDNDTSLATTEYVQTELADFALLAGPTFTGDPKAPTPAENDNDTSIATTAYVQTEIAALSAGDSNWEADGSTNSLLAGIAYAHQFVSTNGFTSIGTQAGAFALGEGTAPALTANAFTIHAPADVAAGGLSFILPGAAFSGLLQVVNASGAMTISQAAVGTGVLTFLATPSSANLASALTGETGTGAAVFADSPVFATKITLPPVAGSSTLGASGELALNTTDKLLGIHSGAKEVAIPLVYSKEFSFDPKAVCDGAVDRLFLFTVGAWAPKGITITRWRLSFEADPTTEVDLDLKRADAFIGVANSAVMDALDTTAGVSTETTAANINGGAVVATGKVIYLEFGTAYTETTHQMIFEIEYELEED